MSVTLNGTSGLVFGDGTIQGTAAGMAFRNRIINGDMRIDQRNAGGSVAYGSGTTAGNYFGNNIDRWWAQSFSTVAGNGAAFTVQQSSSAPTGFRNSLLATVTTAQTNIQTDSLYRVQQAIEGYNIADFGFGAAGASSITLSFWVKSNLTGTFSGSVGNDVNATYPFSYTINAANTWELKTVTITGSTSGTWLNTNGKGMVICWTLAASSARLGTANAWTTSADIQGVTGQTNLMATVGNNLSIAGVQLEKAGAATSFEHRPYATELAMCQRYFYVAGAIVGGYTITVGVGYSPTGSSIWRCKIDIPVPLRTTPSLTETNMLVWNPATGSTAVNLPGTIYYLNNQIFLEFDLTTTANHNIPHGYPALLQTNGSGGKSTMDINAEL